MSGVGTELQKLFDSIGIPKCDDCAATADILDSKTVQWCEDHFDALISLLIHRAKYGNVSLARSAASLLISNPRLALKIMWLKVKYPRTAVAELAAVGIVDHAIDRASRG